MRASWSLSGVPAVIQTVAAEERWPSSTTRREERSPVMNDWYHGRGALCSAQKASRGGKAWQQTLFLCSSSPLLLLFSTLLLPSCSFSLPSNGSLSSHSQSTEDILSRNDSLSTDDRQSTELNLTPTAIVADTGPDSTALGDPTALGVVQASSSGDTHIALTNLVSFSEEASSSETQTESHTEPSELQPPQLTLKRPADLQCGNWQEEYARFHRESLGKAKAAAREAAGSAGNENVRGRQQRENEVPVNTSFLAPGGPRFAVYDCMGAGRLHNTHCEGFGDMIRGVISTFVVALLSRRVFLINAPVFHHGFRSPFINWRSPATEPMTLYQSSQERFSHYSLSSGLSVYSLNIMGQAHSSVKTAQVLLDAVEDPADVVVVRAHRGILHLLLSDDKRFNWPAASLRKMGLQDPVQAFACLMRFLLQPSEAAMRRVELQLRLLQQPGTTTVGVHIRTGDKIWGRRMPQEFVEAHMPLLTCADMVTERRLKELAEASSPGSDSRRVVWFVASDSTHLKEAMCEKWGNRVIVTPFQAMHIKRKYHNESEMHSVVEEAIGEWALFAQCQYHVFRISGWSLTAALLTANPSEVKNFIFQSGSYRPKDDILQHMCNSTEYTPQWLEMSNKWGGL